MIPLRDANPSRTTPHITRILILVNLIVFVPLVLFSAFPENLVTRSFVVLLFENFTMVPRDILELQNIYTLFTSMFLHADIFHIGGNMLFLYVFGDNVEDVLGHFRYLVFYLVCGIAAAGVHIFSLTTPMELTIPTLGASGAISGVMGAYIVLYPRAYIRTLILGFFFTIVSVPAVLFLGFWFLLQLLYTWLGMSGGVAYWAHIGGFVAGMTVVFLLRPKKRARSPRVAYSQVHSLLASDKGETF